MLNAILTGMTKLVSCRKQLHSFGRIQSVPWIKKPSGHTQPSLSKQLWWQPSSPLGASHVNWQAHALYSMFVGQAEITEPVEVRKRLLRFCFLWVFFYSSVIRKFSELLMWIWDLFKLNVHMINVRQIHESFVWRIKDIKKQRNEKSIDKIAKQERK